MSNDSKAFTASKNIGRYKPCFELESGGMATVFLARAVEGLGVHRFVALKRIHPHLAAEPGFVEMFLDEANVLSRIVHPNVCTVYDFGEQDRQYYIAMEYLMGEPVSRVGAAMKVDQSKLDPSRTFALVARIVADACEGLHAAHELRDSSGRTLGVVHRDVSPQNLFVTYDGAVKVVDFGLVRTDQALHRTRTGIVKGKFAYLAPEVLAKRSLDRRADVWGLGVVLWELLTGDRLFWRPSEVETLMAVTAGDVPAPSSVRADIPPVLDGIVARALARDPEERYPTARELGQELLRFTHRCPEPVGLADVADFMGRLFPTGRIRKQELLEVADQISADDVATSVFPRPNGLSGAHGVRPVRRLAPAPVTEGCEAFSADTSLSSPKPPRARVTRAAPEPPPAASPNKASIVPALRKTLSAIGLLVVGALVAVLAGAGRNAPAATATPPVAEQAKPAATASASQPSASQHSLMCPAEAGRYTLEVVPDSNTGDRVILQVRPISASETSVD